MSGNSCGVCGVRTHRKKSLLAKSKTPITDENVYKGDCRSCAKIFSRHDAGSRFCEMIESWQKETKQRLLEQCRFSSSLMNDDDDEAAVAAAIKKKFMQETDDFARARTERSDEGGASQKLKIVGQDQINRSKEVWEREVSSDEFCTHSEYARSFLARWAGTDRDEDKHRGEPQEGVLSVLTLDAGQFTQEIIDALVGGYSEQEITPVSEEYEETMNFLCRLLDGAMYLGMNGVAMLVGWSLVSTMRQSSHADVFDLVKSLDDKDNTIIQAWQRRVGKDAPNFVIDTMSKFGLEQMEALLSADALDLPEENILQMLLVWADTSPSATEENAKKLIQLVRTPFVPVDCGFMTEARKKGYVSEEHARLVRDFQLRKNDTEPSTFLGTTPAYQIRKNTWNNNKIAAAYREAQRDEIMRFEQREMNFVVLRMLGTVNGRTGFDGIASVHRDVSCRRLVCSPTSTPTFLDDEQRRWWGGYAFPDVPALQAVPDSLEYIDSTRLQEMDVNDAQARLRMMLELEEQLRLHPQIQATYGQAGEDEKVLFAFTEALQAHVARTLQVEESVGINLMRSASSLFPELAQISHYVRHNRSFRGRLRLGDEAPDVSLLDTAGNKTSLWAAIESNGNPGKSTLIIGASYT